MSKFEYSKEIANLVNEFLREDDWHFSFDEEKGYFKFGLSSKSKIKKINYRIDIRKNDFVVYGISAIGADEDDQEMMKQMAEFLCRANYGLCNGNFELDFRDGEIRYKTYVDCEGQLPDKEIVKNSIYCVASMYRRYAEGIVKIIFTGCTAKEAIDLCERDEQDQLRELLGMLEGAAQDSDTRAMLARLEQRFGGEGASGTEGTGEEA